MYTDLLSDLKWFNLEGSVQSHKTISNTSASPYDRTATVCVIGVGYVGETLVKEFSTFYSTIGFDLSRERISFLKTQYKDNPNVRLTSDPSMLRQGTHFLISVPTLVNTDNSINTKHILSAINTVTTFAPHGSTIVIESSVCVGMSRQLLAPHLQNYYCGMSPERVDPGRISPAPYDIPKIISGMDSLALDKIHSLYAPIFRQVVPVSSPETAEMTKLYENCFRMVNIAYVNEIADACAANGIDAQEMMKAASTKPFGFMPFTPGLGVGGHCIPVNPHYLKVNCNLPILEKSTKRMAARPAKIAKEFYKKARRAASFSSKSSSLEDINHVNSRRPRILVVGLAFKAGQSLTTNSPAFGFAKALKDFGANSLTYHDPMVEQKDVPFARKLRNSEWNRKFIEREFDAVAICLKQKGVDLDVLYGLDGVMVKSF